MGAHFYCIVLIALSTAAWNTVQEIDYPCYDI